MLISSSMLELGTSSSTATLFTAKAAIAKSMVKKIGVLFIFYLRF
jgi:hypothetical protein